VAGSSVRGVRVLTAECVLIWRNCCNYKFLEADFNFKIV
jgi:hypothetical protein